MRKEKKKETRILDTKMQIALRRAEYRLAKTLRSRRERSEPQSITELASENAYRLPSRQLFMHINAVPCYPIRTSSAYIYGALMIKCNCGKLHVASGTTDGLTAQ